MTQHPAGYGSLSGAIQELRRIGAVEGVHYRLSVEGELLTDFKLAVDTGPMVVTMIGGFDTVQMPGSSGVFPLLTAEGMELVGAGVTAAKMRKGTLPSEIAYAVAVP